MLNGNVHGDNIHGNVRTTINNFHAVIYEPSKQAAPTKSSELSASERDELLESLRFPQLDARLTNLRKAQLCTCEWITQRQDYKEWLGSDDLKAHDGFFWIKGNPGTGKSITMKFLYQKLQSQLRSTETEEKVVICFFFNARGNEFEKSTIGLYRSLLFNLFHLELDLVKALEKCRKSGYHNILESGWQLQMLKEVFEEAVKLLQTKGKQLFCYVDALDECPEDDVQDMVSYFEDLVASTDSRHCRICFSSRHYPQISMRTRSVSSSLHFRLAQQTIYSSHNSTLLYLYVLDIHTITIPPHPKLFGSMVRQVKRAEFSRLAWECLHHVKTIRHTV